MQNKIFTIDPHPPMAPRPLVCQSLLIIEASRSHSDTLRFVGLLWKGDQPEAETSTWQHTSLTPDRHPCRGQDSNPQSQQANNRRPTPQTARPTESAHDCIELCQPFEIFKNTENVN